MRVKNIQVRNFLSFGEEEQSLEFDSINTIVGPNNSGKTNVFRALSLVGELLEDINADTRSYHHNGDLNREFEVKIGVQFDEDEIEALSRYLICTALLANFQLKEGENSSAMENLMKTLIPQNRKRFDKLFESVSLEVLGKGLETNSFEVRLRLGKDDHELFVQRPGIITRESVKPPYLSGFGFAQALLDEARSKKPDEISNFLANKTELLPVIDYAGISLWDLFFKVIEGTYQHAIAIEGFNLNSVEFKLGNLPEFLQLRSFFRKRGNGKENVSLFDVISTIYNSSLVRVSDIRNRPKAYLPVSEIGLLGSEFSLMTGEELPLILFNLRNTSDPKKRRQYNEIAERFKQIYNLEFDVMIDRRLISEDEQDEPVLIPDQKTRGLGTLSNENIHPVGIRLKEVKRVVDELIIQIIKDDFAIPLDYAAAGITESLLLLVALIGHERKTILLDEPALNLHPNMQRKILELLEQAVSVNNNQIILITHSPYFVDTSRLQNTWKFVSKNKATNVIHVGRAIEKIDKQFGQKTTLLLGNIETRSLLFSRGTILVEGPSDKVVVEKIDKYLSLHKKGANIEDNEWVLTSVGGKKGLGTFIGLCKKLGVPYAAIVDRDAIRECEASIKIDSGKIRTSIVFLGLHQNGELTSQDMDILRKFESSMVKYKDKNGHDRLRYSQKCFKTLSQVAKKHKVFVFKKDLEGALDISKSKKDGKPLNALDKVQELIAHDKIPEEFFSIVTFLKEHIGSAEPPVKT